MKKKGLIISTIVMVIVLVASLTTATYAWFTSQASTSIGGFDVSVVPSNVLAIGLRADNSGYAENAPETAFVNGECTFAPNTTSGKLYGGKWTGSLAGLGSSITHNINFGDITNAVGVLNADEIAGATSGATSLNGITKANLTSAESGSIHNLIQANGTSETTFANPTAAVVNGDEKTAAQVAFFDLGIKPTKALTEDTNVLYVVIKTDAAYLGIGAAIHVAYKLNDAASFTDVDAFGASNTFQTKAEDMKPTIPTNIATAVTTWNGNTVLTSGYTIVPITLSDWDGTGAAPLDQLELAIYVYGGDVDCVTDAISTATYTIGLFFGAQSPQTGA